MQKKLVFLKTDEDFAQFRRSQQVSSKNLRLRIRFNTNQNMIRFGFIVPKKTLAKAADRNLMKRRLKAIFQKHLSHIKPSDILCFPQKSSLNLKFKDLEEEVLNILQKGRIWKQ